MKILVRNIARSISEADLRVLFEMHGLVQSCDLIMDTETGASKGFGFVQMPKSGEAKAAMKELNGMELDDSKLRVKKADLPKQKK
jgi:RNA recognition motif-containing protein